MIKEGTKKEELFNLLEEMDSMINIDSLVKTGEKITLECTREQGALKNWVVTANSMKKFKPIAVGKSLKSFKKKLNSMTTIGRIFERPDCVVLCLISVEPSKRWDGKIISNWAEINPGNPYEIRNNVISFKTKTLAFTEEEHYFMTQTGLAFFCQTTGVYYPVTQTAYPSLGRLFDCTAAFNQVDRHLLGTALMLAEKVSYASNLRIIYRAKQGKVRPVLSVAGKRYQLFPQKDFFEAALSVGASQLGFYEIKQWMVTDILSTLTLEYWNPWNPYKFELVIQTGDIPQYSFQVSLFAIINDARINLLENKKSHDNSFELKMVPSLFKGIKDEMDLFKESYHLLERNNISFDNKLLNEIHRYLGKKRTRHLKEIPSGEYQALELFLNVLDTRYLKLAGVQKNRLEIEFKKLFYQMVELIKKGDDTNVEK